jgi:hypothetical protein
MPDVVRLVSRFHFLLRELTPHRNALCGTFSHQLHTLIDNTKNLTWEIFPHNDFFTVGYIPTFFGAPVPAVTPAPEPPNHKGEQIMWIRQERAETTLCKPSRAFGRALAMAALMTGLVLGTATFALAAPDPDNNPPGPRGGAGTNWENPPGPHGGPGTSPDAKPWRPWVRRRIHNALQPQHPLRPGTQRRIYNARHPQHPTRFRHNPRRRTGGIRRR